MQANFLKLNDCLWRWNQICTFKYSTFCCNLYPKLSADPLVYLTDALPTISWKFQHLRHLHNVINFWTTCTLQDSTTTLSLGLVTWTFHTETNAVALIPKWTTLYHKGHQLCTHNDTSAKIPNDFLQKQKQSKKRENRVLAGHVSLHIFHLSMIYQWLIVLLADLDW